MAAFGNSTESHDNRTLDVECPAGCEAPISVPFAIDMKVTPDGRWNLDTRIVGAPVAEHVAEHHPDLID